MYRLSDRKLGEGGYASVFMAIDRVKERQVACKVVRLRKQDACHDASQYFLGFRNASLRKSKTALTKQPDAKTLWREVEILKTLSHVRPLGV